MPADRPSPDHVNPGDRLSAEWANRVTDLLSWADQFPIGTRRGNVRGSEWAGMWVGRIISSGSAAGYTAFDRQSSATATFIKASWTYKVERVMFTPGSPSAYRYAKTATNGTGTGDSDFGAVNLFESAGCTAPVANGTLVLVFQRPGLLTGSPIHFFICPPTSAPPSFSFPPISTGSARWNWRCGPKSTVSATSPMSPRKQNPNS